MYDFKIILEYVWNMKNSVEKRGKGKNDKNYFNAHKIRPSPFYGNKI